MKLTKQQLHTLAFLSALTVSLEEETALERDLDRLLTFCDEVERFASGGTSEEDCGRRSDLRVDEARESRPLDGLALTDGYFTAKQVVEE